MNPKIDQYLHDGCMRCPLGATPNCKVHQWTEELESLRSIVLKIGLKEELKWGIPCYTHRGKNILTLAALKEYCAIGFFKGALLTDSENVLEKPGENTHESRVLKFTNLQRVKELENVLTRYIFEAIEVENAGLKVAPKPVSDYAIPEEFAQMMEEDQALKSAFEALTPGRKKGYLIHFSQAKQAATRISRVKKCLPKIFAGKGLNDR